MVPSRIGVSGGAISFWSLLSEWYPVLIKRIDPELRLCFPTVVANASPLSVLPQFVEVLGRKLDKISKELDRLVSSFTLVSMLDQTTNRFVAVMISQHLSTYLTCIFGSCRNA